MLRAVNSGLVTQVWQFQTLKTLLRDSFKSLLQKALKRAVLLDPNFRHWTYKEVIREINERFVSI